MRREFDRGGAIHLGQDTPGLTLEADTEYVARVGYLLLDDPYDDDTGVASDELATRYGCARDSRYAATDSRQGGNGRNPSSPARSEPSAV